jgi:hypothetical protein
LLRLFFRAVSGPALLVAHVSSSRHFLVAALLVREHPDRRRFLVPVSNTLQVVIEGFFFRGKPWSIAPR